MALIISRPYHPDLAFVYHFGPYNAADIPLTGSTDTDELSDVTPQQAILLEFVPDKDVYIDSAWFRCEAELEGAFSQIRLLRIDPDQTLQQAVDADDQWITEALSGADLEANDKVDFTLLSTRGGTENRVKAGGRIAIVFYNAWEGLEDGILSIRMREWHTI